MNENLEKAFIGQKANEMYEKVYKNGSFNIGAFFLSGFYFLYRKMYLVGIILVALMMMIPSNIGDGAFFIINLIFHLICGFLFYPLYRIHIKKKINIINQDNTTEEEISNFCKKKGGTSVTAALIPILILLAIIAISLMLGVFGGARSVLNNKLVGTWYDSSKDMYVIINLDGTTEFYSSDKKALYMKGKYTITQNESSNLGDEYIITITTTNRMLNGIQHKELYTTRFSIVTKDYKEAVMMNVVSYGMYYLTKIK